MWFSDDSLLKNKRYYEDEIKNAKLLDSETVIHLFYGDELFKILFDRLDIWRELIEHLKRNKEDRCRDILNVPDFDTSIEIKNALVKLQEESPKLIKKLLSNEKNYETLRSELFPTGYNLQWIK